MIQHNPTQAEFTPVPADTRAESGVVQMPSALVQSESALGCARVCCSEDVDDAARVILVRGLQETRSSLRPLTDCRPLQIDTDFGSMSILGRLGIGTVGRM